MIGKKYGVQSTFGGEKKWLIKADQWVEEKFGLPGTSGLAQSTPFRVSSCDERHLGLGTYGVRSTTEHYPILCLKSPQCIDPFTREEEGPLGHFGWVPTIAWSTLSMQY